MKTDSLLSITQYSKEQLQDKNFLKKQIAKYDNKIKQSREKTKDLKHIQDVYKGLLKGDPFYVEIYGNRKSKLIENPCRFCGRECYGIDYVCYQCEKKAMRKDKGFYQVAITCPDCDRTFYPKRLGIPYELGEIVKCECSKHIAIQDLDLIRQLKAENRKISWSEVTNIGKEGEV